MGDIIKKEVEDKKEVEGEKDKEKESEFQKKVNDRDKKRGKGNNSTIDNLVKKPKGKDKAISARVNSETYIKFKKICAERGLTSNACLNMLISDFVIDNKHIIE